VPVGPDICADLAAGSADVGVPVEYFPEVVERGVEGASADVEEDGDVGAEDGAEGVEEPAVRVDFLGVFFL
jgi:hypothetical protein